MRKRATLLVFAACLLLPLAAGVSAVGKHVAVLTDQSDTKVALKTFSVHLERWGDLDYCSGWLNDIYQSPKAVPILRPNGVVLFIAIDKIKEYRSVAKAPRPTSRPLSAPREGGTVDKHKPAEIILVTGQRIPGAALSECSFSGQSMLGKVTVPAQEVKAVTFNPAGVKAALKGSPAVADKLNMGWPKEFKSKALVTLRSGETLWLGNVALVYIEGHIGGTHIWKVMRTVPVVWGKMATKLDLTKTKLIHFAPSPNSKKPNLPVLKITLQNGETITGRVNEGGGIVRDEECEPLAFIGITKHGYAHVPLWTIAKMDLEKGRLAKPAKKGKQKPGAPARGK